MDRGLNELLKWSIENSSTTANDPAAAPPTNRGLDPGAVAALLGGGPSDAELMQAAMAVVSSPDPEVSLEDRLTALDNMEQLVESLDNANDMARLALWAPLLEALAHEAAAVRRMAAWCVGTAVQNNPPSQERLLALGGIPRLVSMATDRAEDGGVRRKAVYALSSAVRNYQPAMDAFADELGKSGHPALTAGSSSSGGKVDAMDMEAVDAVINGLKELDLKEEEEAAATAQE